MSDEPLPPVPNPATAPAEPLITVGTVTAFVTALVALFVSFGLHVSEDRQNAILGVIAVAVPLITAVWGRAKVWSPRTVGLKFEQITAARTQANRPNYPPAPPMP